MSKKLLSATSRSVALVAIAAIAISAVEPTVAMAASATAAPLATNAAVGLSRATDFSSAGRRYYRRGGGGGAAAAAAFAGIVGTGLAIAASRNRYEDDGYYGGGPTGYYGSPYDSNAYYGGGAGYYGGSGYYDGGGYGYQSRSRPYFNGRPLADH